MDFDDVRDRLGEERPEATPDELDRMKQRALAGQRKAAHRSGVVRSRAITLAVVMALTVGTGSVISMAGGASGIPQDLIDGLEGRIYVSLAAPWFHKAARQRAGQQIDLTIRLIAADGVSGKNWGQATNHASAVQVRRKVSAASVRRGDQGSSRDGTGRPASLRVSRSLMPIAAA